MKTAEFDYPLPPELIAQQPLADRAASRLLVLDRVTGGIEHGDFRHLGRYLRPGDLLVLNDTKVIPARLWASQPRVDVLLVENLGANRWSALVKPARRAKLGTVLRFSPVVIYRATGVARLITTGEGAGCQAEVVGTSEFGGRVLQFAGDVAGYLNACGAAPLPPYIKRPATDPQAAASSDQARVDRERYQTVYARHAGAIAAPTAGLHFTAALLAELAEAGIDHVCLTLHVGLGTFRPVKAENVEDHPMHAESFCVTAEAAGRMQATKQHGGRIVAVGTTVARALETLGEPRAAQGRTDIFIRPPFTFRVADALLTNFHLPRSTLLMLVSAFAGRERVLAAYAAAVREGYRFYSYGDCMLIR